MGETIVVQAAWLLRTVVASLLQFFLFLDDDTWCHHHHQAFRFTADTDVFEQSIDVRHLAEHRHATFDASFTQSFDTAQAARYRRPAH